ncbi:MAG: molecular chaperone DnaK [Methylothermaceae bacteria B42]|nr:MAG: molecular chaperone DnaK [Methylothermaceae bacteria B42]HHJ38169.1 molecular chaperone DnaK [Methylothermaceae bacterium]
MTQPKQPRYWIGIDLGTTHTVVAYADRKLGKNAPIERFAIPQLIAPGEVAERPLLPSVRYHPIEGEIAPESHSLPWPQPDINDPVPSAILGEFARQLGVKSQGRMVTSAKSWLCNSNVDRMAEILPWGAPKEVPKVSPLTASASFLAHVRGAWNYRLPDYPMEDQEVVITVPASFDDAARALTLGAARQAGLPQIHLLEEPQAVCYDWLNRHQNNLRLLNNVRLLLVVDLGGGTTDLTLIQVEQGKKQPKLTRVGVGNHLLLGGDNIDLMLAHLAEEHLIDQGQKLSPADFYQLIEQCRSAKERLLTEDSPESATVTVLGSGSKLIGGARSVELTREEVRHIVLDGFFPEATLSDHPHGKRLGLVEFGLPYVSDPAITKHIAAFLCLHTQAAREALGDASAPPVPDAILLNGGVFRSHIISQRLLDIVSSWSSQGLLHLDNPRPDFAVAAGAVAYAMARQGLQLKIQGGAARSYFLVVEDERGDTRGICLLPKGTPEETEVILENRIFALRLGKAVRFNLVTSNEDTNYQPGEIISLENEDYANLPPSAVALDPQSSDGESEINVKLAAQLTEIGTLQLHCIAADNPKQRWQLEFQLRKSSPAPQDFLSTESSHPNINEAKTLIGEVFGKKSKSVSPKLVKTLRGELEKCLGSRDGWDINLLRELADHLLDGLKYRRRSPQHERTWFSLTGFCLRPGFGYPLDDWRLEQSWNLYQPGLQFVNVIQNWAEWWTFWRRIAGGLNPEQQLQIYQDIKDYIDPVKARKGKMASLAKQHSYENIVRLAAVLELLPVEDKIQSGNWLLTRLQKNPKEPEQSAWALGRIGCRIPFYASSHHVVPKEASQAWLEKLLQLDFKKKPALGFAAALLARMSGDRVRDIDESLRQAVIKKLRQSKAPASWIDMVSQPVSELSQEDEKRMFGESLPPGLKLIA